MNYLKRNLDNNFVLDNNIIYNTYIILDRYFNISFLNNKSYILKYNLNKYIIILL